MPMTDLTLYYDWPDVNHDLNMLASAVEDNAYDYDVVVAVNDDLIPATLMATRLNLSITQVKYGLFSGIFHGDDKFPVISKPIESGIGSLSDFPTLLVVVSYFSGNKEVQHIIDFYETLGHRIHLVAIFNSANQQFGEQVVGYQNFVRSGTKITFPWKL